MTLTVVSSMTTCLVGISFSTKKPEIIQMDAKNKKIPADCRLEIERIDFKIELKNFMYSIWRRKGLYQLSRVLDAFLSYGSIHVNN